MISRMQKELMPVEEAAITFFKSKGIVDPQVIIERSPVKDRGDAATSAALRYGKELGLKPLDVAQELASALSKAEGVERAEAASPGFVNITFNAALYRDVLTDIRSEGDSYGRGKTHADEKWGIEHTSPNPNKAMHLGHLHNNLVGMSFANLIENEGAEVIRDCIDNNRGIAIAKLMYGFLAHMRKSETTPIDSAHWSANKGDWCTPEEKGMTPDRFVTICYVEAEKDSKANPDVDKKIRQMVIDWEAKDARTWELWAFVLAYSWEGINRTLQRLGSRWDVVWHEHEHYEKGKEWVQKGLAKGIFKQAEDGAVITNLKQFGLPDTVVQKNDGTALYITQDIALTALKREKFKADKLVWVIGPEQGMHMQQLFAISEQLGNGKRSDYLHVPYGYVGLAQDDGSFKKMSSREGNVILIDDVIDIVKERVLNELENKDEERAEKLAVGAVKFAILKADKDQQIAFSIDRSVDVRGDSGVYVLYTYARIKSILRKAEEKGSDPEVKESESGKDVVRDLLWYRHAVLRSAESYSAHYVAQYLLELCGSFNRWYNEEMILDDSADEVHKLAIAEATSIVIKNGLALLGIEVLEEI